MEATEQAAPKTPGRLICWIVSLLIVLHFFAKFTTLITSGSMVAERLNKPFRPYLGVLFLSSAYQFFAPDPGPNSLVWFRVRYEDGTVRWREWPRRTDYPTGMSYKKMTSLAHLAISTEPHPEIPDTLVLTDESRICLASYVRHISQDFSGDYDSPVAQVEIYRVYHFFLMPGEIREGWNYDDPRLYEVELLGAFHPDGTRYDVAPVVEVRLPLLIADIIETDVKRQLTGKAEKGDLMTQVQGMGLPVPVEKVIREHPEVLSASGEDLIEHIHFAVYGTSPQ